MNYKLCEIPVASGIVEDCIVYEDYSPLSPEEAAELADDMTGFIERTHQGIWLNPETDTKELKIAGQVKKLGGRALRYVKRDQEIGFLERPASVA